MNDIIDSLKDLAVYSQSFTVDGKRIDPKEILTGEIGYIEGFTFYEPENPPQGS